MFRFFTFFTDTHTVDQFMIFMVLAGIIVPLMAIISGIVFANLKKWGKEKRWYSLSVSGAAWMIVSILILTML